MLLPCKVLALLHTNEREGSHAAREVAHLRTIEIDGIRGWASFSVLLFHVLWEMLGVLVPSLRSPLLAPLLDGHLAVYVFFVLSGDALSSAFFRTHSLESVDRLLVNRYARLTVPICMSCTLVFVLMRAGLDFHLSAPPIVHEAWLGRFLKVTPSIPSLLKYSLIGVYANHRSDTSYNPMLWTMSLELVGSMATFLTCYVWARLRSPAATIGAVALFLLVVKSEYGLFFAGVLLAYCRSEGLLERLKAHQVWQVVSLLAIVAVGFVIVSHANEEPIYLDLIDSVLLVLCFYTNRGLLAFFRTRVSRFLGDLSFPIYLVQFPVIISLMSWLLLKASRAGGDIPSATLLWIALAAIAATFVTAKMFRLLEEMILRFLRRQTLRILAVRELSRTATSIEVGPRAPIVTPLPIAGPGGPI